MFHIDEIHSLKIIVFEFLIERGLVKLVNIHYIFEDGGQNRHLSSCEEEYLHKIEEGLWQWDIQQWKQRNNLQDIEETNDCI